MQNLLERQDTLSRVWSAVPGRPGVGRTDQPGSAEAGAGGSTAIPAVATATATTTAHPLPYSRFHRERERTAEIRSLVDPPSTTPPPRSRFPSPSGNDRFLLLRPGRREVLPGARASLGNPVVDHGK